MNFMDPLVGSLIVDPAHAGITGLNVFEPNKNGWAFEIVEKVRQVVTLPFNLLAWAFGSLALLLSDFHPAFKVIGQPIPMILGGVAAIAAGIISLPFRGIEGLINIVDHMIVDR